jgi:hypothetical protein
LTMACVKPRGNGGTQAVPNPVKFHWPATSFAYPTAAPGEVEPASCAQTSTQEGYERSATTETKLSSAAKFGCDFRIDTRSKAGTFEEKPGLILGNVVVVVVVVVVVGGIVVVVDVDDLLAKEEVAFGGPLVVAWTIPYATPPK